MHKKRLFCYLNNYIFVRYHLDSRKSYQWIRTIYILYKTLSIPCDTVLIQHNHSNRKTMV